MTVHKVDIIRQPQLMIGLLEEQLKPLREYIELAIVFGSLSSGNFQIESDIDLLVVSDTLSIDTLRQFLDPLLVENGIFYDLLLLSQQELEQQRHRKIIQEALGGIYLWENEMTTSSPQKNT